MTKISNCISGIHAYANLKANLLRICVGLIINYKLDNIVRSPTTFLAGEHEEPLGGRNEVSLILAICLAYLPILEGVYTSWGLEKETLLLLYANGEELWSFLPSWSWTVLFPFFRYVKVFLSYFVYFCFFITSSEWLISMVPVVCVSVWVVSVCNPVAQFWRSVYVCTCVHVPKVFGAAAAAAPSPLQGPDAVVLFKLMSCCYPLNLRPLYTLKHTHTQTQTAVEMQMCSKGWSTKTFHTHSHSLAHG